MIATTQHTMASETTNILTSAVTPEQSYFKPILNELRSVRDLDVANQNVLVRVDANVPRVPETGEIADRSRLNGFRDTVHYLLDNEANAVILLSHLGKGDPKSDSLRVVADVLPEILKRPGNVPEVWFREDYASEDARDSLLREITNFKLVNPNRGLVVLLENTRFNKGEKAGDPIFAYNLSELGTVYVNDAFGAAHRADDASVGPLAERFAHEHRASIGFLMERELARVERVMLSAKEPFVVLLSGSKIETKAPILEALVGGPVNDMTLILAGETGMALAAARGLPIGARGLSEEKLSLARALDKAIEAKRYQVILPIDAKVVPQGSDIKKVSTFEIAEAMPEGHVIFDIGPKTVELFSKTIASKLSSGGTLVANGTVGVYENPLFKAGTVAVNEAIKKLPGSVDCLIGGGDTGVVAHECGLPEEIISTGGGALLDAIEKGTASMPALKPLKRNAYM